MSARHHAQMPQNPPKNELEAAELGKIPHKQHSRNLVIAVLLENNNTILARTG